MDNVVSIIIPVYNASNSIEKCINSVLTQTYSRIEIILVNDCSKDDSLEKCLLFAKKDYRIKVISNKSNMGLGLTRNEGLECASGEYIMFLDADDFIEKDMVLKLITALNDYSCDLVSSCFVYNGKKQVAGVPKGLYLNDEIKKTLLVHLMGTLPYKSDQFNVSVCTKLYKASIVRDNKIYFKSENQLIWEDMVFNFDYLTKCKSVYVLDDAYYHYDYNPESLTHKYDSDRAEKILSMYEYVIERIADSIYDNREAIRRAQLNFLGNMRACIKLEVLHGKSFMETYCRIRNICNNPDFIQLVNNVDCYDLTPPQKLFSWFVKHHMSIAVYFSGKIKVVRDHHQVI